MLYGCSNLTKSYGSQSVLNNITLELYPGLTLILGSNGCGKSTLLRILSGLIKADSGQLLLEGAVLKEPPYQRIGHLGHSLMLYADLTVAENLHFFANLLNAPLPNREIYEKWDLTKILGKRVRALSRGQQLRVSLARAFLNNPLILLLDEPSSALDDQSFKLLEQQLLFNESRISLIASHDTTRFIPLAERVLVLKDNKIISDASNEGSKHAALEIYRGSVR